MIEEAATVVRVEAGYAWVDSRGKSGCGACHQSGSCGASVLDRLFRSRREPVKALNRADAALGETVVVGLNETALLRGSLLVYLLPLAGMIGLGLLASALSGVKGPSEGLTIVASLAGLAGGLMAVGYRSRGLARDPRYLPVVLRRQPPA